MTTHKGTLCIKTVKQLQVDPGISPTCDFSLGEALAQVYPLLDLIFEYLPLGDLKCCLEVSTTWKETAEQILDRRVAPSWFTCFKVGAKGCKSNTILHSPNLNFNNVEMGFILYDSLQLELNAYICLHRNTSGLSRKSVPDYLEDELVPKSVNYCMLAVDRVVSIFNTKRNMKEVEYHGSIFDGVFFPKVPSIRTVLFHCDISNRKTVQATVRKQIRRNEEPKCILIFTKYKAERGIQFLLKCLVPDEDVNSVAFGGGIIRGSRMFHRNANDEIFPFEDTMCILFLKDEDYKENNFEAFSCVISEKQTEEEFNSQLQHFKENIKLKHHSLGFRISCSSDLQETELEAFQATFPGLPLLGVYAAGELGWNCYPNALNLEPNVAPSKPKRLRKTVELPRVLNYFSTIFVLLTWDK
ncbi:uncharacterized protein LOC109544812 [Dendroctonus ponderosae]